MAKCSIITKCCQYNKSQCASRKTEGSLGVRNGPVEAKSSPKSGIIRHSQPSSIKFFTLSRNPVHRTRLQPAFLARLDRASLGVDRRYAASRELRRSVGIGLGSSPQPDH